jgi:hypothetical protein
MNKKYIYWGLGLVAVGGLAYYFMSGKSSGAKSLESGSSSSDAPLTDGANSSANSTISGSLESALGGIISAGSSKKEVRRNCRQEAKNRGLRGREKRQWRRDCKRSGGYDDGLDM